MKMRKFAALLLAVVMILSLACACGEATPTPDEATPTPVQTPTATPDAEKTPEQSAQPTPTPNESEELVIEFEVDNIDEANKTCYVGAVIIPENANHKKITELHIPAEYKGYKVVGISWDLMGQAQWGGGRGFGTVDNPNYRDCYVKTVYIPATVEVIEYQVFWTFSSIESIVFEDATKLKDIGHLTFTDTKWAKNILLDEMYLVINNILSESYMYGDVVIPENVVALEGCCFKFAPLKDKVTSITIPEAVTVIDDRFEEGLDTSKIVFKVKSGSYAQQWATGKGYTVEVIE